MKLKILMLLPLLWSFKLSAQLTISPGTQFSLAGFLQLTLQNTDFINNGNFTAGNSTVSFQGNAPSSIGGSQSIQLNELEINKTNGNSVLLQSSIAVNQRVLFSSGFLNLNGFNLDLGSTGHLDGEQESTRITGPNGGEVLFTVSLNSPTGSNPANLGIFITAGPDLGNVTIRRGHQSQVNGSGLGNSILRYYDLVAANNTNLNATLRFKYFDAELNGLNESSLVFFESQNNRNWTNLGFTSRDVVANFVEKTGINSFIRFTLSSPNNILPVSFTLFNANCESSRVLVTWKTAQEQNSSHFNIERSADGSSWAVIGSLPAAGTSTAERSYSFRDDNPLQNGFYRIAEFDLDGRVQYTGTLRSSCSLRDDFNLWPNPARDMVFLNIVAANPSQAMIRLYDNKGALVKVQNATLLQGSNQLAVDIRSLANGVYTLSIGWNNGQMRKAVQLLKQ
ncbi:MAG TPA: T9SS type A sorting domain-containing protein [Chitinophagaceae bacterium]|nr:T9SS type A sorting domain-containing protein [Chitinophagaceae bacterium]